MITTVSICGINVLGFLYESPSLITTNPDAPLLIKGSFRNTDMIMANDDR